MLPTIETILSALPQSARETIERKIIETRATLFIGHRIDLQLHADEFTME